MRHDILSLLRQIVQRETTLTHLALVAGVALLSLAFTAGPLGSVSTREQSPNEGIASAQADASGPGASPSRPSPALGSLVVSARGDRPTPVADASPTPTATPTDAPADTPAPEPAPPATATRTEEVPTATAAPAPTAAVTPAPSTTATSTPAPAPPPQPAPAALPAPPAPKLSGLHVGLQAGHWKESELPGELAVLRTSTGAVGSGWREVDVNLDLAQRVAGLLRDRGIQVDLLPATVPVAYKADLFVAIHGDANSNTSISGYKLARARWSRVSQTEDYAIRAISAEYAAVTGMKEHPGTITEDMRQYYAFNWPQLDHAVAPTTPAVIIETGFLTTAADRNLLLQHPDRAAAGIANGIIRFLSSR